MDKQYEVVTMKEALRRYEFREGGAIFGGQYAYNVLNGTTTTLTTPSVIIFANGELTSKDTIEIVNPTVFDNNPAKYLDDNQELAKSVKYILIVWSSECEQGKVTTEDDILRLNMKYNGFIKTLVKN